MLHYNNRLIWQILPSYVNVFNFLAVFSSLLFFPPSSTASGLRWCREVQFNRTITAKTWPMLCGPVNEFPLLFHSWQEFLITATLLFFFSRNKLVKCHAKCKLINKQKLRILGSLFHSTLLCLMLCPVEGEACDWRGNFFLRTR